MYNSPEEASQLIHLLVQKSLPNLSIKVSYFAYECTQKGFIQWHPKDDRKWSETTPIRLITASFSGHHFYNQPFWIHTRIILPLVLYTSFAHSPFVCSSTLPNSISETSNSNVCGPPFKKIQAQLLSQN
jgi:hypothetical protein